MSFNRLRDERRTSNEVGRDYDLKGKRVKDNYVSIHQIRGVARILT